MKPKSPLKQFRDSLIRKFQSEGNCEANRKLKPLEVAMESKSIFDNFVVGKFEQGSELVVAPIESRKVRWSSLDSQMSLVQAIKALPPKSKERYSLVCTYINLCCNTFATASYDASVDQTPTVTWTDIEFDTEWFGIFVDELCNKDYTLS